MLRGPVGLAFGFEVRNLGFLFGGEHGKDIVICTHSKERQLALRLPQCLRQSGRAAGIELSRPAQIVQSIASLADRFFLLAQRRLGGVKNGEHFVLLILGQSQVHQIGRLVLSAERRSHERRSHGRTGRVKRHRAGAAGEWCIFRRRCDGEQRAGRNQTSRQE